MPLVSTKTDRGFWFLARFLALAIFVGLLPLTYVTQAGPRFVWTVVIALLPLSIVLLTYYRWRMLCPLAFFSMLGNRIGSRKRSRIPKWFEKNHYLFQFGFLLVALSLRHLFTNGNIYFLSAFLLLIVVLAFLTGFFFLGKTWCNYLCPVGIVEKLYCEPKDLKSDYPSACEQCHGCKKSCPDINLEKTYWGEIANSTKRKAYYAYPGLVFGFYAYFFLYAGNWDYYFSGAWTEEINVLDKLNASGFFFAASPPRWLASPLTLLFFSIASFLVFSALERFFGYLSKEAAVVSYRRHYFFVLTSIVAFNLFYVFAGAPTFDRYPLLHMLLRIIVVSVSFMMLLKGIRTARQIRSNLFVSKGLYAKPIHLTN